jgi:hypothetical protein
VENRFGKNKGDSYREWGLVLSFEGSGFNGVVTEHSSVLRGYTTLSVRLVFMIGVKSPTVLLVFHGMRPTNGLLLHTI